MSSSCHSGSFPGNFLHDTHFLCCKYAWSSQNTPTKDVSKSTCRLLEDAASSYNSTALLPNTAFMSGHSHTRVLRVAPVSSEIGPPSFPTTSAALEEVEPEPQPLIVNRVPRGPHALGGLSRSLSASASSSSGLTPNKIPAGGIPNSGDSKLFIMFCIVEAKN